MARIWEARPGEYNLPTRKTETAFESLPPSADGRTRRSQKPRRTYRLYRVRPHTNEPARYDTDWTPLTAQTFAPIYDPFHNDIRYGRERVVKDPCREERLVLKKGRQRACCDRLEEPMSRTETKIRKTAAGLDRRTIIAGAAVAGASGLLAAATEGREPSGSARISFKCADRGVLLERDHRNDCRKSAGLHQPRRFGFPWHSLWCSDERRQPLHATGEPKPWTGVRSCLTYGQACPSGLNISENGDNSTPGDEENSCSTGWAAGEGVKIASA